MTRFHVAIQVMPRRGILDPQGKAIADALKSLGYRTVGDVRLGKHLDLEVDAADEPAARAAAAAMCDRLLANPVTEDYAVAEVRPL